MYIGNARTLKTILGQLSDAVTFSEDREQLLLEQKHRSFRFVLRFNDAETSYGYDRGHPLNKGYTINGQLLDSTYQIRVSIEPKSNAFIESLRKGDTLELLGSFRGWDPAYNILEMESCLQPSLPATSAKPSLVTSKTPGPDARLTATGKESAAAQQKAVLAESHSAGQKEKPPAAHSSETGSKTTSGRYFLSATFTTIGCFGCIVTALLILFYSSHTSSWTETPAQLIYYKLKNRRRFITYDYVVDGKEYRKTDPAEQVYGPAGVFFWVVYKRDHPAIAEISYRRNYDSLITLLVTCPLLLLIITGIGTIIFQTRRRSEDSKLPAGRLTTAHGNA